MNSNSKFNQENGYKKAMQFVKAHYENFPVVSLFVPRELRKHLAIIYWFARTADDLADEGTYSSEERLRNLSDLEIRLKNLLHKNFHSDFECALFETIKSKSLSCDYFFHLLEAFKQDTIKNRYLNFSEVLDYCSNSANPVGRLVLELIDQKNDDAFFYSDKICTALQITNFIQDSVRDFEKNRIYYPQDEMQKFGVTEKMFELKQNNLNFKHLVEFSIGRVIEMFNAGKPLLNLLKGRIRQEIAMTIEGGELILKKIRKNDYDVLNCRPVLEKQDFVKIFFKSYFIK